MGDGYVGHRTADIRLLAANIEASLTIWQSPIKFQEIVETARNEVGPYVIFRTPAWKFWREAWTLGRFALISGASHVKLTADIEQFPDGRVKIGEETLDIEVTEAMMPDRRRASEYAPDAPRMLHDPVEEWDRRLDELPRVLDRAIRKKVERRYGQKPFLLVYLNIGAYEDYRDEETRSIIAAIKGQYEGEFRTLFVLWGNELM
jgi:hypothetical protein